MTHAGHVRTQRATEAARRRTPGALTGHGGTEARPRQRRAGSRRPTAAPRRPPERPLSTSQEGPWTEPFQT